MFDVLENGVPTYILAEDMQLTDVGWYQRGFDSLEAAYKFACKWAGYEDFQKSFEENFPGIGEPFTLISQNGPVEMSIQKVE